MTYPKELYIGQMQDGSFAECHDEYAKCYVLREYQNNPASLCSSGQAQPASMGLHAAPADAQEGGVDNTVNQTGAEDAIEIGDIVQFFAASHPLNEPTEYIGRVQRDYKGLHAANRYLPISGVRIVEKGIKNE